MRKKISAPTARFATTCLFFCFFLLPASLLHATNFIVSNGNNAGAGSLRQAITDANADPAAPHTITFTVSGVINITTSLPTITRQVTIDGGNTVTISGPGGDSNVGLFVLGTGSGGSIIRNLTMRNTGLEPIRLSVALSNITIENMLLTYTAGTHYMNRGILANAAVTNLTIKNVQVTNLQDNFQGLYFGGNVTNSTIDGYRISGGAGGTSRGIHIQGVVNGLTIKNSVIDLDDPATGDDGDYGIVFYTTASNVTIDSSTFRDNEVNAVYCGGVATNFSIKNSQFDNLDGWTKTVFVYFPTNTSNLTIDKNIFDAKYRTGTNDGDYGLRMLGVSNQTLNVLNNQFKDFDTTAFYIGGNHANNHDNVLIKGNTFTRNGNGTGISGGIDFLVRNTTSDGGAVVITENTFIDNNGEALTVRPGNTTTYVVPNLTISKNIIYNTKSTLGAVRVNYVTKIVITQNSIYNNQGLGIELAGGTANCGYEGTNTPQILSSTETSPGSGIYNIGVKMPSVCGSGNCSVEIFSNEAGTKGVGGQHYVTTKTGVASGNQTLTNVTGSFAEITSAPYGTWTATFKLNNNCGTSEFSNKKAIKPNGPAGINNGIAVWLRGDDLAVNNAEPTASGQVITGWEEFSGGGPSATTVINNPLTKLNGINFNPVADMDADGIRGAFTNAPSFITTPTTTTVAVFNPLSITASGDRFYCLYSQGGSDYNVNTAQIEFYRTGNNINSYRGNTLLSPAIPGTSGVTAFDKPGVFSSVTSATNHTSYYNGANMGSANYSKGNFAISQWFVGTGWNTTNAWASQAETDFAEVFTYNRVLSATELQKVQSYMALKYGIAMKQNYVLSSGTQVWDITANATHSKEIAALARDNVSVLYQKQARAFHADEVVSIASGNALAVTNNDNADSIINNLSVFMWGNDSASTALTTAFTAGTYSNTRMARVWKVQKTNWVDKDITIKLNNGKTNNYLLISTTPTFTTITQELPLSSTGTITLSSALLANGNYFTFGRQQKAPGGVASGLGVWTKADEGVALNGNDALTWEDQGPSQRIWPRVSATNPLVWSNAVINYNPAIQFPGPGAPANYFNYSPQFTSSYTQGEAFSVQSSAVNNVAGFPWHFGGTSGSTPIYYRYTDNNMYLNFGTNARRNFSYGTKNMALPVLLNVNTASNSWTASLDGKIFSGPAAYTTSFAQAGSTNAIGVGYGSWFNGPVSEVILYNRKLNATERLQVNSYMAIRYGITLDQTTATDYLASDGTTIMWKASDNAGFANDIAGIGRDEIGSLYQKQSRSNNTLAHGDFVAIAVGNEIAVSNAANTDTIPNNKSFLVWGDNNAAIGYTTNVTGSNVTVRMPKVWKVDKTNWADRSITIRIDGSATNTYLLISNSDATFATISQELPMNADSTITIGSDLLPDGAYFTFGKELVGPGFVNPNIVTWQRADDGISDPATWYDFSGNDNDASQATVADQPAVISGSSANAINFNRGYLFTSSAEWFDYTNDLTLNGTANKTVLWVAKSFAATGTTQAVLSHSLTGANLFLTYVDNTYHPGVAVGGGGGTCAPLSPSTASFGIPLLATYNRTSASSATMYTNGAFPNTNTCTNNFVSQNMRIGARSSSAFQPFNGNIAEVIVYNRSLTAVEMQRAHSYLALKYGITLDQATSTDYVATDWDGTAGTKMWTAADNGIYKNNIAGIGRDDKTALYQKQSRSVSDTLITIAAGSVIAADNVSNASEIDDLSFFAWADNNGAKTFSIAVSSVPNATFRMARVWKVDRTNWSDQDITFKAVQGGDRYLLVNAADPTFGAGTVEYAINTATGTVTINSTDLPDGAYFTLATKIVGPACVNNGIVAWLRSDYAATANGWIDFSGNQINAAQATVANQPAPLAGGLNYNTALQFNGTTDYLQIPQATITGKFPVGNAARTLIGVGITSTTADQILMTYGTFATNQAAGLRASGTRAVFEAYGASDVVAPLNTFLANKSTIISGRYTGGTSGTASVYANGTNVLASSTQNWNTVLTSEGAQVGKYIGEVRYWNGNIGEVIVYNRDLTNGEFQRVSSYLALKYGITLNQTTATDYIASDATTRMWTAADNTGYNFRITGIGRDDCTELHQKQSLSADAGILAIAIGDEVAASNPDNADSITTNNSYLVFADDNGATTYNTAMSGLNDLTARMARIWKVDKTNWTDAGVTFRLTGGTDKIYMVVSSDNIFDGSDAAYQLDAGGNVTITTDLIPDGAYFTFAKALSGPGYVNVGVQLWLRADDNVSTVDNWLDYSGNDNHATQPTAANQPVAVTNSVNYNPSFDFDGTDDYMDFTTNAGITGTNPFTVASVSVRNGVGSADAIIAQQGNTAGNLIIQHSAANQYAIGLTGTGSVLSTGVYPTANIPYMSSGTRSGNLFSLYTNGSADGTGTQAYSFSTTNLRLGNRAATADAAYNGHLNEVVVYNRALTPAELRQVHSYLALKHGITMTGDYIATDGTTSYWTAANNTGYLNNITGIGRDDNTALYQKQSRSVNTASNANMVAIGLGTIAATNKDNTNTIADDMSFLVWGDNGATGTKTTEYPTALDPGGCSKITRLQREWKVQVTGNPGTVQVQMYLAGLVPNSTGQSDLKLLIDDDGDFSSGTTSVIDPASYDDATQIVTFNDISFSDGQYFTLVTDLTNQAPGGIITNLYTWYRADKGITTSTGVNLWADQSVSLKDAAQATGGAQPVYNTNNNLINFNPALTFDGSNDLMSNTAISHSTVANGEDIFAVVLPNAVAGFTEIVSLGTVANTGTTDEFRFNNNRLEYLATGGVTIQSITSATATNGMVQLANANRSSAGAASIVMNGATVVSGTINQTPVANQLNIGARRLSGTNALFFNGRIAEVAIYNRQLSVTERQKVASYLAIKYGITLTHNYLEPGGSVLWDVTTNTGYNNNITGISRDDCNGLHQKQSKSINTAEALVTIGNYTGISLTNAANPNTLDNNTALLLGDNNANRTAWVATGAPLNRERIARTWRVQKTGNISTVTIQVPANSSSAGVKLPLEKDGAAYLLVSTSGDFVNDVNEVPMTLNGTDWEAAYDFTNGQYFTFATNDACVSAVSELTNYGAVTTAATDKCYINGWILFRDPLDVSKYIAAIYDPAALIDRTKITANVNVNTPYIDLGKGNSSQATRLMRRMLQLDCASCYDATGNPNPNFTIRMFYSPTEKSDAESVESNNMESIKTANGITDPHFFKWFKASNKTVAQVVSGLTPAGIGASGQEWLDGELTTGQLDGVDYVDFAGVNSFSTFGGAWVVNVLAVLPVTWLDVQAIPAGNNTIKIKWTTTNEINNAGFVVERSQDGQHYQPVASVPLQTANAGTVLSYSADDNNVSAGVLYYYRIKQTDRDGHSTYSRTVSAIINAGNIKYLVVKPNPVIAGTLRWDIYISTRQPLQVSIVDMTGRVLKNSTLQALAGANNFVTDITGFSTGTYLLRIRSEDGSVSVKSFIVF